MPASNNVITANDIFEFPESTKFNYQDEHEALHMAKSISDCVQHITSILSQKDKKHISQMDRALLAQLMPQELFYELDHAIDSEIVHYTMLLEYLNFHLQELLDYVSSAQGILSTIRNDMITVVSQLAQHLSDAYTEQVIFPSLLSFDEVHWTEHFNSFLYHFHKKYQYYDVEAEKFGGTAETLHHCHPEELYGKRISPVIYPEGKHGYLHKIVNPSNTEQRRAFSADYNAKKEPDNLTLLQELHNAIQQNTKVYYTNSQNLPPNFDDLWSNILSSLTLHYITMINHRNNINRSEFASYHSMAQQVNPIKYAYSTINSYLINTLQ